jgi:hypothetical protein
MLHNDREKLKEPLLKTSNEYTQTKVTEQIILNAQTDVHQHRYSV